jgi:hypothetical protein
VKVYLTGERSSLAATHTIYVSPAGHLGGQEMPHEWVSATNEPLTFPVVFENGVAEVESNLGEYLTKYKIASKTKLIFP